MTEKGASGGGAATRSGRRTGSRSRTWLRGALYGGLVLAVLPLALMIAYIVVPPVSTLMIGDFVRLKPVSRTFVPIEQISPYLAVAVVMSEDGQFCRHGGVDWGALKEVAQDAIEGEKTRGASTIPMQTMKNLFLWPSRSYVRKGLEVPLALVADIVWSKRRMLEIYLNIVEWGPGIYGAEAAAQHYFKKSARALGPREAARLAVTLPSPETRNPAKPSRRLAGLAGVIERRSRGAEPYLDCVFGN
ncbi:MAG: monofunctional biosynthetic peptidoglycan transglycosylase [Hyphomicrobiales bacterium]